MTHDEYARIPGANWSALRHLLKSPQHYRYALQSPDEDTASRALGRAAHCAVLEPAAFAERYAVWAGDRRAKGYAAFLEASGPKEVLTAAEYEAVKGMSLAVHNHPVAREYVTGGQAEELVRWQVLGRGCKGRLDYRVASGLVDLKTTRDASPEGFAREVLRYLYHGQAAWYVDGARTAGLRVDDWTWVAVESSAPYAVAVYRAPPELLELGRGLYRKALERLEACEASGKWPGYSEAVVTLQVPQWAFGGAEVYP